MRMKNHSENVSRCFFSKKLRFVFVKLEKSFNQTCVKTCIDFIVTERTFSFFFTAIVFLSIMFADVLYTKQAKYML